MENISPEDLETIREFLVEAHENLSRLDQDLVALEKSPDDRGLLSSIFRTIHTIKGACGFLAFSVLEAITHQAETLLSQLRDGKRKLTPQLVSLILETVDATRKVLAAIEANGREGDEQFDDLTERLRLAAQLPAEQEELPAKVAAAPPLPSAQEEAAVAAAAPAAPRNESTESVAEPPAKKEISKEEDVARPSASAAVDANIRVGVGLLDKLMDLVGDNRAAQLSSSWGFGINATTENIYKQYIAQGQSLLQASGDSGAYKGAVMQPADDPNLTIVGGTSLTTAGAGGPWQSEKAWSGSGGGISTSYPIPSYQQGLSMSSNGGSISMRNLPDVALTADIQMFLIEGNGQAVAVGGTSAAAPLWAGFIALANQQAAANGKQRIGFLNPLLYAIGKGNTYSADLNDIRSGNNNGFSTVSGYDLVTGWGSPAGQPLINDLTGVTGVPGFTLSASTSALSVARAASGTATVTVSAATNLSGNVNLSITGLPTGVTTAFNPSSTKTTSTITFTASSTAAAGAYPLTITGVSGNVTHTTPLLLTITVPGFTLSLSPAALSLARGSSIACSAAVTPQGGFSGSVAFSATGLPSGVTATFGAYSPSGTSVTFNAASTALPGTYSVTITGASGALTNKAVVTLTVVAPGFTLSLSPATLSLPRGATATSSAVITPQGGFNSSVAFSATGLPAGVTATFGTYSPGGTSVTFNAASTALAGTYPVTITGASGTLTNNAALALTVTAPGFALTLTPTMLSLPRGSTANATVVVAGQGGFSSSVSFAATGLPSGVTVAFGAYSAGGTSVILNAAATASPGTYSVTITGASGALTNKAVLALTILAPPLGTSLVNLAPSYNINALVADGVPFSGGGLDGGLNGTSTAYSANLTGVQQTIGGTLFYFGPANAVDAVSGKTITLPVGQYNAINILATGVNGSQAGQLFKVTYSDGSATQFIQSMSDWYTPQHYTGEATALAMAYRDTGPGLRDNRIFYLYAYQFPLNVNKTVASITLPGNRNVVVLAASLTGPRVLVHRDLAPAR